MPSSNTQNLYSFGSLDNVKESPIILLLLPCVKCVFPYSCREEAKICLVLVFPLLPVIAITLPENLFLENCAIFLSETFVSFTNNAFHFSAYCSSETSAPEAPFEIADSIKSWPSNLSPLIAINKSPFCIVLSSMLTPETTCLFFKKLEEGSDPLVALISSCLVHKKFKIKSLSY